jgi:hypothetical protein
LFNAKPYQLMEESKTPSDAELIQRLKSLIEKS